MMCPSSPSAINAAISAATRPAFNAYDPSRVPKSSVFGVASIISRLSCGQEIDDLPSAKDFQNSLCASWKIEKSRRSAMQKERSSGIILSYKSTKKASFFLVGKARRCARVSSDISSSIYWSPYWRHVAISGFSGTLERKPDRVNALGAFRHSRRDQPGGDAVM